jgi:putative molybdopterin biosynthesis protein
VIRTSNPNIYLRDIALGEAIAAWHTALAAHGLLQPLESETVPLNQALGRVTAAPVFARISSPHYHASAMDGYAVHSDDTLGATETAPKRLTVGSEAIPVDTGDPLPVGKNAVIMIEQVQEIGDWRLEIGDSANLQSPISNLAPTHIEITNPVPPWQYVRAMGEDMVATELVLPANHRIRPQDLGAMAGCGHVEVEVYRRPRVAVIPTGTELVPPSATVRPGDIIEYNSLVLGAMAEEAGCVVTRYPIVKDDYDAIKASVLEAMATHDLVVVNAGSSAGSEDFTARVVAEVGQQCVHGIAIRPGHPVVLGVADARPETKDERRKTTGEKSSSIVHRPSSVRGVALAGIPGYPVSAVVTFDLLVRPLLYRWQGQLPPERPRIKATLTRKIVSPMGDDEFVRVTLGQVGERVIATPLSGGAGVITSLVKADGVLTIPRFSEGVHAGTQVEVELHCEARKIANTIVAIGSHDMALDLLGDALRRRHPELSLSSAHVGSVSGLLALQRDEAHLAGSHLLDEDTGEYNAGWIKNLLTPHGVRVILLGFVNRVQGLIVARGNPKNIHALEDLIRKDVSFVNRQRGAGTRALLDFELKKRAIEPRRIRGYERQEFTHLSVAAAVASGAADCGLGILAAARALDLDFMPLFTERYDLVIPVRHYESQLLAPMLALIRDRDSGFRNMIEKLGGYETARMGEVIAEL